MWIYNSMTRKKEQFQPLHEGKVGIYACGPTVYNFFHIGNARPFITFDVLRRQLEREGYEVTFVQNFTDIDDKMIRRANEEGITVKELGEKFIAEYYKDAKALGIRPATVHPKATEHIAEIIALVQRLVDNGRAYAVNGDVYYRVSAFPGYGKLSGQSVEDREMGASERLDVETDKENPADFALWKAQKPGEPAWESPWGMGRPGWHIECSAMSMKYLGETFDIHCGGKDLLFPHHENEIAQSEGATGKPYVRYWMHNGFINVDNQKMSKSLGNFFTVRDIAKEYDLEAVRLFMLSAHYRSPINFSRDQIAAAHASLTRLYTARDNMKHLLSSVQDKPLTEEENAFLARVQEAEKRFDDAMDDDMNTADALGAIFELVKDANVTLTADSGKQAVEAALKSLKALCDVLGILQKEEDALPEDIQRMVDERAEARKNKDWKRSDELRDAIKAAGYILEDSREGQKVRKGGLMKRPAAGSLLGWLLLAVCASLLLGMALPKPRPAPTAYAAAGHEAVEAAPVPGWPGLAAVNSADASALTALPGVGEGIAAAITAEREANGPFFYPEDLLAVRGIGPAKLEMLCGPLKQEEMPDEVE